MSLINNLSELVEKLITTKQKVEVDRRLYDDLKGNFRQIDAGDAWFVFGEEHNERLFFVDTGNKCICYMLAYELTTTDLSISIGISRISVHDDFTVNYVVGNECDDQQYRVEEDFGHIVGQVHIKPQDVLALVQTN